MVKWFVKDTVIRITAELKNNYCIIVIKIKYVLINYGVIIILFNYIFK